MTSTQRLQGNEVDTRMFEASGYKFGGDSISDSASIFHFKSPSGDTATVKALSHVSQTNLPHRLCESGAKEMGL
jgi:hypothetical protein